MTIALPASLAGTWRPAGTRTGTTSVLVASITAETTLYEPVGTASTLAELGASDVPLRSLFAVDLEFSPPLPSLGVSPRAVFSMAAPKARGQFVDTIEDEGLIVDGTRETHAFEAANGTEGRWFVLDVSYPIASGVAADGPDRLPAETHVAVWPTETTYGMAGGTTPLEMPADVAASIDGEISIDPERDRERIAELVRSIDPGATDEQ
ncbi:hypothetical protein ACFO5R_13900 [Halosolutus amylolyticus]|uniref:Uncharacterized protein n=1 Tax=Halosolutus amylolyticus TaxID=2932267 RepID=A0ABD5PQY6_9EURY|nr:hypothetical protein [Halosolutus amylolyticus]